MRTPDDCPRVNFLRSHVKTAQYLDLDYLKDMKTNLPYMMPNKTHFVDTMKRLDVKKSDKVVCYDTHFRNVYGYRVGWMLDTMGHPDVSVLDGGLIKWIEEGKEVVGSGQIADDDFDYDVDPKKIAYF